MYVLMLFAAEDVRSAHLLTAPQSWRMRDESH